MTCERAGNANPRFLRKEKLGIYFIDELGAGRPFYVLSLEACLSYM
jgi:hypothetical protein